jgi:hypothetical protein
MLGFLRRKIKEKNLKIIQCVDIPPPYMICVCVCVCTYILYTYMSSLCVCVLARRFFCCSCIIFIYAYSSLSQPPPHSPPNLSCKFCIVGLSLSPSLHAYIAYMVIHLSIFWNNWFTGRLLIYFREKKREIWGEEIEENEWWTLWKLNFKKSVKKIVFIPRWMRLNK